MTTKKADLKARHIKPANTLKNGVDALRTHIADLQHAFRHGDAEEAKHVCLMLSKDARTLSDQADGLSQVIASDDD